MKRKLKEAEQLFLKGITKNEMMKILRINGAILTYHLNKKGYYFSQNNQKYTYDESKFKHVEDEETAYWLGFLYADGYIGVRTKYELELALQRRDRAQLVKFRKFMNTNVPIKDKKVELNGKTHNAVRLNIFNKVIVKNLIKKGCIPLKTHKLVFPDKDIIPDELLYPFLRGYFDGDGSISLTTSKTSAIVEVIGTKEFLTEMVKRTELPFVKYRIHGRSYGYLISRKKYVIPFLKKIYSNSNVYLDRKYELAKIYLNKNNINLKDFY